MTEIELLLATLHDQRQHVLAAVEGLSDDDGRRAVLPSGWDVRGLVQHLARDDEAFWFSAVIASDPETIERLGTPGWKVDDDRSLDDVVAEYNSTCERSDAILAACDLDAPPTWWPDFFGRWRLNSVREILLHQITETACHAGHLDAVRELIDGRQWLVLD